MSNETTTTYVLHTECGQMEIAATSIEQAKEIYSKEHGYNFDATETTEGSWYYIGNFETGEEFESCK